MQESLFKIIDDLGENFKDDVEVLKDIYEEISSIASNISHLSKNDERLYPYIKIAVKSIYLCRGGEGLSSISESGKSLSFDNVIGKMRDDIVKAGLRRLY